jgi:glyoxylase-like metal-dependent hydrolase (beta-lactamase superfamily II)
MPPDPLKFNPPVGVVETLGKDVRRIVAPNASLMTFRGTNTYLLGSRRLAVIDPGPDNKDHLRAIMQAVSPDQMISHILVTHAHIDHSSLATALSQQTGAPVYAFGLAAAGRSAVMQHLFDTGLAGGGEGIDDNFCPDIFVPDQAEIVGDGWQLKALHTPGHIGNHLCFQYQSSLFTGDLVMGWASSLVSPPDGDLTDFMQSCQRLQTSHWRVFHPGHGAPVTAPNDRVSWLLAHRLKREASILTQLAEGPATASELAAQIYSDTTAALQPVATRNVLAHLIDLTQRQRIGPLGSLSQAVAFGLKVGRE